ncbi:unnamed protein product, partial [marine sediment metagenome]
PLVRESYWVNTSHWEDQKVGVAGHWETRYREVEDWQPCDKTFVDQLLPSEPKNVILSKWDNSDKTVYEGTLVNIENNKLFFMVDKEVQEGPYAVKDVEDYQVIFDIDTFDFEVGSHFDSLEFYGSGDEKDCYRFYSAGELEFLVGKYLSVNYFVIEDPYTKAIHKGILFQPSSPLKSSIISFTQ